MKKENIFDLYAEQHKDEPEPAEDMIPGEVKPEDVTPTPEVTPTQEVTPEPPQEPEPKQEEGGKEDA